MALRSTVHRLALDEPFPAELSGGAVSVGNFDGVHRGHQALIHALAEAARSVDGPAVAVTFDPHPLRLLAPERFMPVLTPADDRAELLLAAGANHVVLLQTSPALLGMAAGEFLRALLLQQLRARAVVEGFNFAFGRGRSGDIKFLQEWCPAHGLACNIVPPHEADGVVVSSSRVRHALDTGDVTEAARLLGRPYRIRGTVVHGEHRGATLGFPTANLAQIPMHLPADGVYAGEVDGRLAAVNIGPNPTFASTQRKVEAHLLDFAGDLYGQGLAIALRQRVRDTTKFNSADELVAQLHADLKAIRHGATSMQPPPSLREQAQDILRREVAQALALDGAELEVLDVIDGVARVRFSGACASCPATIMTLVMGVEQELRKHLPEIEYLEAVP